MRFERGKDVNDALKLGVKKDAIKITGITYILNEQEHDIKNFRKMEIFVERFCQGDLPKDSLFGIEKISFYRIEESIIEEPDMDSLHRCSADFNGIDDIPKKYKIGESKIGFSLAELLGKPINIQDTLLLMPTLEELDKNGFSYLMELEESVIALGKDYIEIRKQLATLEGVERQKEWDRMDRALEKDRKEMKVQMKKSKASEETSKKKKKRKLFRLNSKE